MKIRYPIVCTKAQREEIKRLLHKNKKFGEENAEVIIKVLEHYEKWGDIDSINGYCGAVDNENPAMCGVMPKIPKKEKSNAK